MHAYDKYVVSDEGAAKPKAFKDAMQAAQDQAQKKEEKAKKDAAKEKRKSERKFEVFKDVSQFVQDQAKKKEEKAKKVAANEKRENERACKAAVEAIERDDALKKNRSAYWVWLGENRARIVTMLGSSYGRDVAKKGQRDVEGAI